MKIKDMSEYRKQDLLKEGHEKSVKVIVSHLRNSVSHYNFKIFSNKTGIIDKVKFYDYLDKKKKHKTFEAEIPLSNLKMFILKFSQEFLYEMENQQ